MSAKQAVCEASVVLRGRNAVKSVLAVRQAPQMWMQELVGRHF